MIGIRGLQTFTDVPASRVEAQRGQRDASIGAGDIYAGGRRDREDRFLPGVGQSVSIGIRRGIVELHVIVEVMVVRSLD